MELTLIKPKNLKVSDKYSANLYKYLKKNPNSRIYMNKTCLIKEVPLTYQIGELSIYNTYVGQLGGNFLIGNKLIEILRKPNKQKWAFMKSDLEIEDITDQFMHDYKLIGRCLWDGKHNKWQLGTENRFTYINDNERFCNWCGCHQNKRIEVEVIEREHIIWD